MYISFINLLCFRFCFIFYQLIFDILLAKSTNYEYNIIANMNNNLYYHNILLIKRINYCSNLCGQDNYIGLSTNVYIKNKFYNKDYYLILDINKFTIIINSNRTSYSNNYSVLLKFKFLSYINILCGFIKNQDLNINNLIGVEFIFYFHSIRDILYSNTHFFSDILKINIIDESQNVVLDEPYETDHSVYDEDDETQNVVLDEPYETDHSVYDEDDETQNVVLDEPYETDHSVHDEDGDSGLNLLEKILEIINGAFNNYTKFREPIYSFGIIWRYFIEKIPQKDELPKMLRRLHFKNLKKKKSIKSPKKQPNPSTPLIEENSTIQRTPTTLLTFKEILKTVKQCLLPSSNYFILGYSFARISVKEKKYCQKEFYRAIGRVIYFSVEKINKLISSNENMYFIYQIITFYFFENNFRDKLIQFFSMSSDNRCIKKQDFYCNGFVLFFFC